MSDASSPDSTSPGIILREARLRRGLSPEQVTAETNISVRYVQALEEDDYKALPGQAFARGYVRRYAQLVQVDADALIPLFDQIWQQQYPAATSGFAAPARKATAAAAAPRAASLSASALVDQGLSQLGASVRQVSISRLLSWGSLALLGLLLIGTMFWQGSDEPEVPRIDESMPLDIDAEMAGSAAAPAPAPAELPPVVEPAAAPVDATAAPVDAAAPVAAPAATTPVAPAAVVPAATPAVTAAPATAQPVARPAAVQPLPANVIPVRPATAAPASAPVAAQPAARPTTAATTLPAPIYTARPLPAAAPASTTAAAAPAPAAAAPSAPPRVDSLNFSFTGKSWISVRDATGQELVYGLKSEGQAVTVTGQAPFSINIGNVKVTTLSRNGKPVSLKPYTRGEIASFRLNK